MAKKHKPSDVIDLLRRCAETPHQEVNNPKTIHGYQTANNSTTIHFTPIYLDSNNTAISDLVKRAMGVSGYSSVYTGASIKVVGSGQVILTTYIGSSSQTQFTEWKLPLQGLFNNKLIKALNLFNQHYINKVLNESK